MKSLKSSLFFVILHIIFLNLTEKVECQVGIVYNPFIQDEYRPDFNIKEMLKLIAGDKFRYVATYGVGAPKEVYLDNSTQKRFTSSVHSSIAAAEINKDTKTHKPLFIYQGLLFQGSSEELINSQIDTGFEVASTANRIYNGTVSALIFSTFDGFDELFQIVNRIKNISFRARKEGFKFGVRLWDCVEKIPTRDKIDQDVIDMLKLFDFIICRTLPNLNTFVKGPELYQKIVTNDILLVENAIKKEMGLTTKVILETGWPGGTDLNGENTVENMFHLLALLRVWAIRTKRMVFFFEAFDGDNNCTDGKRNVLWGEHYGLWFGSSAENNSETVYIDKVELIDEDGLDVDPSDNVVMGKLQMAVLLGSFVVVLSTLFAMMIVTLHRRMTSPRIDIYDR
ncbi:unnamed protein product [Orchesella dallaii]|uniref:Uncharacterized protein n=1 Tax=Orchesella dallaii TaxID=48710 RepID=A0ABP1R9G0_9HEXA